MRNDVIHDFCWDANRPFQFEVYVVSEIRRIQFDSRARRASYRDGITTETIHVGQEQGDSQMQYISAHYVGACALASSHFVNPCTVNDACR